MAHLLRSRSFVALLCAAAGLMLVAVAVAVASPAAAHRSSGSIGKRVTLATGQDFGNYDVAADAAGTAYIGWLSASHTQSVREVHLCKLPPNANSCVGGVQTTSAIEGSTASGLRVLSTPSGGKVTLVWVHDTAASQTGPEGAEIAEATAVHGLNLSTASDVADAPSNGSLMDVEFGPNFSIWTVARPPLPLQKLQVHPGLAAPHVTVSTPFLVGGAQIAFTKGKPIMAIDKDGAVSESARYAAGTAAGHFGAFHRVSGTWTNALSVLKGTAHGVRLIATSGPDFYRPAIAKWNGHGFGRPALTADHNACAPSTHDASTDASGRLLDVSIECAQIAVADYVNDDTAAMYRFPVGGTATFTPQIASGARGIATVVWSKQTDAANGDILQVLRLALPDTTHSVHKHGKGGQITLIGPTTCLPPSLVHIKLGAKAAKHWAIHTRTIKLGNKTVKKKRINGATLTPGTSYTLHGTVVFAKGSSHNTVKAALTFKTCPAS
jgi:hypothetical protein